MIKFDVPNRWTGDVQFTAKINCSKGEHRSIKLRLAVEYAINNKINLSGTDLRGTDLSGTDLSGTDLSWTNLSGTDLSWTNLSGTDLRRANLSGANLRGTDLSGASLSWANLREASLSWANLREANLRRANLSGANLSWAKNLVYQICPEHGSFQAWKKLSSGHVALIEIPARAKRLTAIGSRKCRASVVKTLAIYDDKGNEILTPIAGNRDSNTIYKKGRLTKPDKFCDDARIECSNGIHFFMTQQDAEDWR